MKAAKLLRTSFFLSSSAILILMFQNCGKANFVVHPDKMETQKVAGVNSDPDSISDSSDIDMGMDQPAGQDPMAQQPPPPMGGQDPAKQPVEVGDPREAYSGACEVFADQKFPLSVDASSEEISLINHVGDKQIAAAKSINVMNFVGKLDIDSVENLSLKSVAGHLLVKKADMIASLRDATMGVQVSANKIDKIANLAGSICIHAGEIGSIENVASETKIMATKIKKISNYAGTVRVYGAEIEDVGNFSGYLCLHDGAKVLNKSNVSGEIRNCD